MTKKTTIKLRGFGSKEYPAIWAWGKMMGSYGYYMEGECERAKRHNAPRLAIYMRDDRWHTLNEVTNPDTIRWFRLNAPELAKEAWGPDED